MDHYVFSTHKHDRIPSCLWHHQPTRLQDTEQCSIRTKFYWSFLRRLHCLIIIIATRDREETTRSGEVREPETARADLT